MLIFRDWQNVPVLIANPYVNCAQIRECAFVVRYSPPVSVRSLVRDIETFWDECTRHNVDQWDGKSVLKDVQTCSIPDEHAFDIDLSRSLQGWWRIDIGWRSS